MSKIVKYFSKPWENVVGRPAGKFTPILEPPQANLNAGMRWFLGNYTTLFIAATSFFGHLFSGRYKSLVVYGSSS